MRYPRVHDREQKHLLEFTEIPFPSHTGSRSSTRDSPPLNPTLYDYYGDRIR